MLSEESAWIRMIKRTVANMRLINMNRIIISKTNKIRRNYSFKLLSRLISATTITIIRNHLITLQLLSILMDKHIRLLQETSIIFHSSNSNSNNNRNHSNISNFLKSRYLTNNHASHRNLPMPNQSSTTTITTELALIQKKLVSTLLAISSSFCFASSNNLSNPNKTLPKVHIFNNNHWCCL